MRKSIAVFCHSLIALHSRVCNSYNCAIKLSISAVYINLYFKVFEQIEMPRWSERATSSIRKRDPQRSGWRQWKGLQAVASEAERCQESRGLPDQGRAFYGVGGSPEDMATGSSQGGVGAGDEPLKKIE